jgi:Transmembrane secretion effector
LVTVEWNIDPKCRLPFLEALWSYARERRRDGAYDWALFEDLAQDGRFIETFLTDSQTAAQPSSLKSRSANTVSPSTTDFYEPGVSLVRLSTVLFASVSHEE